MENVEFVMEKKPDRTSYSVRFFDENGTRILGCFFTKMYDQSKKIKLEREKLYTEIQEKYGQKIQY